MADPVAAMAAWPLAYIGVAALLGLVVGSFLNVVIHRLPEMMEREWQAMCAELAGRPVPAQQPFNLWVPRSRCPHCGHTIRAVENIPLLSYLMLRGKCRACGAAIGLRYPLVEVTSGVLAAYAAWHFGFVPALAPALIFCWVLLVLTCIDLDTQLLPDQLTQPLLWLGLLANLGGMFTDLSSAVIGAAAGYLSLWSVYWLFKLVTGKEGMGFGDFKLLAAIGAWLGWQLLPVVILLSSVVGALIGIGLILFARRDRAQPIPFGPYLAGGGLIALFWGQALTQAYLAWL